MSCPPLRAPEGRKARVTIDEILKALCAAGRGPTAIACRRRYHWPAFGCLGLCLSKLPSDPRQKDAAGHIYRHRAGSLSTHIAGALFRHSRPPKPGGSCGGSDFHDTSNHASWLNMIEIAGTLPHQTDVRCGQGPRQNRSKRSRPFQRVMVTVQRHACGRRRVAAPLAAYVRKQTHGLSEARQAIANATLRTTNQRQ